LLSLWVRRAGVARVALEVRGLKASGHAARPALWGELTNHPFSACAPMQCVSYPPLRL